MKSIIAALALVVSAPTVHAQNIDAGETSFKKCVACHAIGEGAANKIGPALNGLEGRRAGTIEGYSYTDANKSADIVWNAASFKEYIQDPRAKIPGTKMLFPGVKNEKEIGDLWAYLAQFKPDGKK